MAELDYDYLAGLVEKAQSGSSDAFAELYAATYQKQYRFTYQYIKDAYLAQDILQEMYILVLKNIKKLKNPRLFISWLNQINFRLCFDMYQKQKLLSQELNNSSLGEACSEREKNPSPEQQLEHMDTRRDIMDKILSLPPKEAQAIMMKYYNDMKLEEIAYAMDCSRSTVKRYLAQGRETLGELLGEKEGGDRIG